jgi:hypothetical protein
MFRCSGGFKKNITEDDKTKRGVFRSFVVFSFVVSRHEQKIGWRETFSHFP